LKLLGVAILVICGCETKPPPAPLAFDAGRFQVTTSGVDRHPGTNTFFEVVTIVDKKLSRETVVLRSSGSVNPPKVEDEEYGTSMVVLGTSQVGKEK